MKLFQNGFLRAAFLQPATATHPRRGHTSCVRQGVCAAALPVAAWFLPCGKRAAGEGVRDAVSVQRAGGCVACACCLWLASDKEFNSILSSMWKLGSADKGHHCKWQRSASQLRESSPLAFLLACSGRDAPRRRRAAASGAALRVCASVPRCAGRQSLRRVERWEMKGGGGGGGRQCALRGGTVAGTAGCRRQSHQIRNSTRYPFVNVETQ